MEDAPASDVESGKPSPASEVLPELDRRPFGSLEFQVSEVVGRLEAGVNSQDVHDKEETQEKRRISTGFFEPEETSMDEILKILEDLVLKTDPSSDSLDPPLLPTDPVTRAAILSHSIVALFGRLERSHASRLGTHIATETTRWIIHMFRLPNYHAYYHQEQMEGLVKVTRMLLHHKYPRYLEDGALAFVNRLPCIYSCVASPLNVVQHLCRQLGLPLACVRPVPVHPSGRGMDTEALNRLCEEDTNANRTPLLVLGEAGVPPLGAGSALRPLARVCHLHHLHLHLRGHALALPAALTASDQLFDVGDSLTLTPGPWFGVPGLPAVTLYRGPEAEREARGRRAADRRYRRGGEPRVGLRGVPVRGGRGGAAAALLRQAELVAGPGAAARVGADGGGGVRDGGARRGGALLPAGGRGGRRGRGAVGGGAGRAAGRAGRHRGAEGAVRGGGGAAAAAGAGGAAGLGRAGRRALLAAGLGRRHARRAGRAQPPARGHAQGDGRRLLVRRRRGRRGVRAIRHGDGGHRHRGTARAGHDGRQGGGGEFARAHRHDRGAEEGYRARAGRPGARELGARRGAAPRARRGPRGAVVGARPAARRPPPAPRARHAADHGRRVQTRSKEQRDDDGPSRGSRSDDAATTGAVINGLRDTSLLYLNINI